MLLVEFEIAHKLRTVEGISQEEQKFLHKLLSHFASYKRKEPLGEEQVKELDRLIDLYGKDAFIMEYQLEKLKTQRNLA